MVFLLTYIISGDATYMGLRFSRQSRF